jgi:hypothetical protein
LGFCVPAAAVLSAITAFTAAATSRLVRVPDRRTVLIVRSFDGMTKIYLGSR